MVSPPSEISSIADLSGSRPDRPWLTNPTFVFLGGGKHERWSKVDNDHRQQQQQEQQQEPNRKQSMKRTRQAQDALHLVTVYERHKKRHCRQAQVYRRRSNPTSTPSPSWGVVSAPTTQSSISKKRQTNNAGTDETQNSCPQHQDRNDSQCTHSRTLPFSRSSSDSLTHISPTMNR